MSYLVLSFFIVSLLHKEKGQIIDPVQALKLMFPKDIYTHRSTLVDLKYWLFNRFLGLAIRVVVYPLSMYGIGTTLAPWIARQLSDVAGQFDTPYVGTRPVAMLAFTLGMLLVYDFIRFFGHYLYHKIPALWELHKVHHNAEVLNPFTVRRLHPLEWLPRIILNGVFYGLGLGVFYYLFVPETLQTVNIMGVVFLLWFAMIPVHFRHSHIWLSYGWLSYIFISPAQHQLHHSAEPRHLDKNFAFLFSFWDLLFGTLYVPKSKETFRLGLRDQHGNLDTDVTLWASIRDAVLRSVSTLRRTTLRSVRRQRWT